MQIVVSILPEGKQIILEVQSSDSVLTVKEKIKDKEGIPSEEQQLFYSGNLLLDSDVLANHNIKNSDNLVVRQVSHRQSPEPEVCGFKEPTQPTTLSDVEVLCRFSYEVDDEVGTHVPNIRYYTPVQCECRRSVSSCEIL